MYSKETPNLELPQWQREDYPDFLTDMNQAFRKIDGFAGTVTVNTDTFQKTVDSIKLDVQKTNDTADDAKTVANAANTIANDAKTTADAAKSTADDAKMTADTADTKADNAQADANTAYTEAKGAMDLATNNHGDIMDLKKILRTQAEIVYFINTITPFVEGYHTTPIDISANPLKIGFIIRYGLVYFYSSFDAPINLPDRCRGFDFTMPENIRDILEKLGFVNVPNYISATTFIPGSLFSNDSTHHHYNEIITAKISSSNSLGEFRLSTDTEIDIYSLSIDSKPELLPLVIN